MSESKALKKAKKFCGTTLDNYMPKVNGGIGSCRVYCHTEQGLGSGFKARNQAYKRQFGYDKEDDTIILAAVSAPSTQCTGAQCTGAVREVSHSKHAQFGSTLVACTGADNSCERTYYYKGINADEELTGNDCVVKKTVNCNILDAWTNDMSVECSTQLTGVSGGSDCVLGATVLRL